MVSVPVIQRELVLTARSPANYRLRWCVGIVATLFLCAAMMQMGNPQGKGAFLFASLNGAAVLSLVFIGALATADSVSKERREGTMELLFLTPLTARQLIHAKFFSRLVQVATAAMVLLPITAVTLLMGGVSKVTMLQMLLAYAAAIPTGLAAGILASSFCKQALPSVMLAIIIATTALTLQWFYLALQGAWESATSDWFLVRILCTNLVLALCVSYVAIEIASDRTKAGRVSHGESARTARLRTFFLTPRFWKETFRRSMRRRMERNPLVWLEYRSAWRRSARWLLVLALIIAETYYVMISDWQDGLMMFQVVLGFALALFVAVTSASSFKVEKETGALELLLVAPLRLEAIIVDRVRAVLAYYKPAFLTWIAFLLFVGANFPGRPYEMASMMNGALLSVVAGMITIPLAGLYFATRLKNFIPILLCTIGIAIILPFFGWIWLAFSGAFVFGRGIPGMYNVYKFPFEGAVLASHVVIALQLYSKVGDRLAARNFA